MKRIIPWLGLSLLIGLAALVTFWAGAFVLPGRMTRPAPGTDGSIALLISFGLSALWVLVIVVACVRLRHHRLWLLIGLPGAMLGPIMLGLFGYMAVCESIHSVLGCEYVWLHTFSVIYALIYLEI